jgi:hypothetical protein
MYRPLLRPTTEWGAGVPKSFPECLEYLRQHPLTPIGGWLGLLSPEWPERPYLSIEADERMLTGGVCHDCLTGRDALILGADIYADPSRARIASRVFVRVKGAVHVFTVERFPADRAW